MRWLDWASSPGKLKSIWLLIFVVALGALAVRAPRLRMRPMHTDEAVHADKFGTLLEQGIYRYEPHEYHGPTLNYFTLIPAWISSARDYAHVTEFTLRIVPVAFGVALVLLTLLVADGLGPAALVAAVLAALSPAMVFYSRYYIQEMLLVCFTFGVIASGYRYVRTKALFWAVTAGVFAGLMHATKETAIIAFGGMGLALVLTLLLPSGRGRQVREASTAARPIHLILAVAAALGVSALFYSSFLTHPRGVLDSYLTYATYFGRAGGADTVHVHPWYYYLRMLLFARYAGGPIWTEGWIVLLACVGLAAAVRGVRGGLMDLKLVRFIALYTVAITVVYSAIPYKTPWCVLSPLHGMTLLAGVGAVALLVWARRPMSRAVVIALLVVAAAHLAFQTYRANFVYYADSRNPYVYAHPTEEVFTVVAKVEEYVGVNGLGQSSDVPITVAVPGNDYWPLPWYLRAYCVSYTSELPRAEEIGPLVLVSDKLEDTLAQRLYVEMPAERRQMYMYLFDAPYYVWFRPKVKLLGFVRKDLWNARMERQDPAELIEDSRGERTPEDRNAVREQ